MDKHITLEYDYHLFCMPLFLVSLYMRIRAKTQYKVVSLVLNNNSDIMAEIQVTHYHHH